MSQYDFRANSEQFLNNIKMGLWVVENREGIKPVMYVDEKMRELIGSDENFSPDETYSFWYDRISPDNYEEINKMLAEDKIGKCSEIKYSYFHPTKGMIHVRSQSVCSSMANGITKFEGVLQEVPGIGNSQTDVKRTDELMKLLAGDFLGLYYVNLNDETGFIFNVDDLIKGDTEKNLSEAMNLREAFGKFIATVVHKEDRENMRKALENETIRERLRTEKSFTEVFRRNFNGNYLYCEMKVTKYEPKDEPAVNVAIGFLLADKERQEQIKIQRKMEQNLQIIDGLASEYEAVFYVNLATDEMSNYSRKTLINQEEDNVFVSGIRFSEAYRLFLEKRVYPEDREMMASVGTVGNIMRELKEKKSFVTIYRSQSGKYCEMKLVKAGDAQGTPKDVALGFANKDAEIRFKQEEEKRIKRNIDIIEILASEYSAVYYIDLTTGDIDSYSMNKETESELERFFKNGIKYEEAYTKYVDSLVFEEDREMMMRAGSLYNILNELSNKKTFTTRYRSVENEIPRYCEMKFVKVGDDENPSAVAVGFSDKDEVIRTEIETKERLERDMAVISGLSDDFSCVLYVNYYTFEEVHYRIDPMFEKHIPDWMTINNFQKRIELIIDTIVHPDDRNAFREASKRDKVISAIKKENVYYVNFRTLIDDEETYYQAKFVRDENSDTHLIAGFRNVDAETKREMSALKKAETASKAKSTFLFNMSHDIRTPMNAIMGFTDMAIKNIDNKDRTMDSLRKVKSSSEYLLSLINDILDMSRIEADKMELEEVPHDLFQCGQDILPMLRDLAEQKELCFSSDFINIRDRYVYLDYLRMNQALINLVSNSVKYTNEGGRVWFNVKQIKEAENGIAYYEFTVKDTGIGMSKEFLKTAFDTFSREKTSTISKQQGTGLGLAITKRIVEKMNGEIKVESEQDVGSMFTITVPFRIVDNPEEVEQAQSKTSDEEINLNGKRILIVEDNELNREISVDILADAGLVVEEAEDGKVAYDMVVEKGADYYDAILMDIQMPVMDGYESTRAIREKFPDKRIPIIALSANAFNEDKAKAIEAGMDDHQSKPIVVSQLFETLKKYCR